MIVFIFPFIYAVWKTVSQGNSWTQERSLVGFPTRNPAFSLLLIGQFLLQFRSASLYMLNFVSAVWLGLVCYAFHMRFVTDLLRVTLSSAGIFGICISRYFAWLRNICMSKCALYALI